TFSMWEEPSDSLKYQKIFLENEIEQFANIEMENYLSILKKIDFEQLLKAQNCFYSGFEILQKNSNDFEYDMSLTKVTKWGKMHIGSLEDDSYRQQYAFILDPSGNDRYLGRIATNWNKPYFWHLDIEGDDYYKNDKIGDMFFANFGLGIHQDEKGNDYYYTSDFGMSASFGCYIHLDNIGNDHYISGLHSLAAATWGVVYFAEEGGNDSYHCSEYGQGFGSTMGISLLYDKDGSDTYYAGGKYFHKPLAPKDYRSLAQGFGFGIRPHLAGGIGVLYDVYGNDSYQGGVYAQGVGYWYALGILLDDDGNDFYDAVYYPQGSGIHLAGGFLADLAGEDHYYSKHGPGQGAGHDYAVGFFIDREGNDSYNVEGGNGLGLSNSVGIFLDVKGNDRYSKKSDINYGYGKRARSSGSIGIFLDTAGEDSYPGNVFDNNSKWQRGFYGFGLDTLFTKTEMQKETEQIDMDFDETFSIKELFSIAAEWDVGSSKKRVEKARALLMTRENETAQYIYENKLGTQSSLEFRAIEYFAKNSPKMSEYFCKALQHSDSLWVKNTITLIAALQDTTYLNKLVKYAEERKYTTTVLKALGNIPSDKSREILSDFIESSSEKLRFITAQSLKEIEAEKLLMKMKDDESFLVRALVKNYFLQKEK
ncbi:MAG: HEAT repeat domain-containing protein, partial [Candidatus Cloacimonadota bacterium]|nr:HEAT repeat domain-containing protein [Candidatus Cloacimonadota bacterium]